VPRSPFHPPRRHVPPTPPPTVYLDSRFGGTTITSEQFNTAGRSVKIGLTASVIVSQWTWAATLLQSSNVAWNYGGESVCVRGWV